MPGLSKSRLIAHRQCSRKLWLKRYRPDLEDISLPTQAALDEGYRIGDLACARHPEGVRLPDDLCQSLQETRELVAGAGAPLFEATLALVRLAQCLEQPDGQK